MGSWPLFTGSVCPIKVGTARQALTSRVMATRTKMDVDIVNLMHDDDYRIHLAVPHAKLSRFAWIVYCHDHGESTDH